MNRPDNEPGCDTDDRGWPILHASCGAVNPANRHACVLGEHQGHHCDDTGATWLDNGL